VTADQRTCEQCGNSFVANAPHQRFDHDECRYQHHIEQSVAAACQRVEPHPLQEVRDQRTVSKHDRDLGGLIKQAIVDRIKTTGECFPDDLIGLYPEGEVDRCRQLATAQFGSLSAPRGSREPLIREKGRRKSSIPARKGGKATVWEFTPAGRIHYGLSASSPIGLSSGPSGGLVAAAQSGGEERQSAGTGSENAEGTKPTPMGALDRPDGQPDPSDGAASSLAANSGALSGVGNTPVKSKSDAVPLPPTVAADSGAPDSLVELDGARRAPSMYDPFEDAA
jgi:hypothetical protein